MGYDAMANGAPASAVPRDIAGGGKKKRINRSAKLKQCKLDARREQWLSQVKNKDPKVTSMAASPTSPLQPSPLSLPRDRMGQRNSEMRLIEEERGESGIHGSSDSESSTHSPTSSVSGYRSRKGYPLKNEFSSRTISNSELEDGEEEERKEEQALERDREKRPLDDWEAVADALFVDKDRRCLNAVSTFFIANPDGLPMGAPCAPPTKPEPILTAPRAWKPDDASRPRSLPSLSKQCNFTADVEQQSGSTRPRCTRSSPSACPICCEDLDVTDSRFLPCACGFRLCLFCHKRILEEDGRCPGCRKHYGSMIGMAMDVGGERLPFRLSRSCSMNSRS